MTDNTNMNAVAKNPPATHDAGNPLQTSDASWEPTNPEEMKVFIAINILFGVDPKPEFRDYWSEDTALHNGFVKARMGRQRYEKLFRYFHCSNPVLPVDPDDKLAKVRTFLTVLQENFPRMFTPGRNLSVDEAMIAFNGRLSWKQYMPKKPVKWGIKLWCLCDSETGYCLAFYPYTGAGGGDEVLNLGLGYTVVMTVMREYLLRNHHVYIDNFFSSVQLASDLQQADTYVCGTVRKNRRVLPNNIDQVRLQQYESVKWISEEVENLLFIRWKDKRDVYMLSTNNDGNDTQKPRTRFRQDEMIDIPTAIKDYNSNMGGVDFLDQMRSYYNVGRTGRRWWK
ncbi:piggyBac transposable element-derived protein 4-like [Patella vulgata]|uniref:piggyBac transposable element-derived protein 4-like n=1 Tax=Patella vulgata TaxID=6465 RepID=UPI0024A919BB|nr:piggyBac transposable element-derived protein 4-like [Patella vulgata]